MEPKSDTISANFITMVTGRISARQVKYSNLTRYIGHGNFLLGGHQSLGSIWNFEGVLSMPLVGS